MIVVLKYNTRNNKEFINVLENLNLEYSFTLNESVVLNASHIILPDTYNIHTAIRKMQFMNLYSVLRMIKKPMLGINNGFSLMCNNITDIKKLGLGLFPIDSKTCSTNNDARFNKNNYTEIEKKEMKNKIGKINILRKTKLLEKINIKTVKYNFNCFADVNDFTTSLISNHNQQFSLTCENENYYSIQMEISSNQKLLEKLIGNFIIL